MKKFEPYSRRELRRRRSAWIRDMPHLLLFVLIGIALATVLGSLIIATVLQGGFRWYFLGALHVALLATVLFALETNFLATDSEAIRHVRGARGEDFTRDELRRAKRRRLVWGWVDSITLQRGDLDHLVVTRRGGLVAIDSKWRNEINAKTAEEMARDAKRAALRAQGVARTLLQRERGGHRAKVQSLTVTPVVVVWGAAQRNVPDNAVTEGVRFIAGPQLVTWLRQLDGDLVPKDAAMDALNRLMQFRETAWQDA